MSAQLYIAAGIAAASLVAGWTVRGWKEDAVELALQRAETKVIEAFKGHETVVAKTLEDKLSALSANEKVLERTYEKLVDRPVYRNVCIDDDGLRYIERRRKGEPAELADPLPAASQPAPGR